MLHPRTYVPQVKNKTAKLSAKDDATAPTTRHTAPSITVLCEPMRALSMPDGRPITKPKSAMIDDIQETLPRPVSKYSDNGVYVHKQPSASVRKLSGFS